MQKILLSGCNGQMGLAVSALCADSPNAYIVAGLDLNTAKKFDYPVYADPMEYTGKPDVCVDFSHVSALPGLLDYCQKREIPLVIATTGHDPEAVAAIEAAGRRIPIFRSANMSLGISLLTELVKQACKTLGEGFDIEIIERHHNRKLDAPSGTANMLYDAAAAALPYEPTPIYNRHDVREARRPHDIGMHAVRGGTVVGEHEVGFYGHHEVITLSHSATSREVFAAGAVRAALFMSGATEPGLYSMKDLIEG